MADNPGEFVSRWELACSPFQMAELHGPKKKGRGTEHVSKSWDDPPSTSVKPTPMPKRNPAPQPLHGHVGGGFRHGPRTATKVAWEILRQSQGVCLLEVSSFWEGSVPYLLFMVQKCGGNTSGGWELKSHYLQGLKHPRWCRISEPSTVVSG